MSTVTSFRSMDTSTAEQWAVIGKETAQNQSRVAERVLDLLRSLADITDGFATDQLTHCLQTATRAERDGRTACWLRSPPRRKVSATRDRSALPILIG